MLQLLYILRFDESDYKILYIIIINDQFIKVKSLFYLLMRKFTSWLCNQLLRKEM